MEIEGSLIERPEAIRAITAYLMHAGDRLMEAAVLRHADPSDHQSFALMRGSGNDLTVFEKYLAICVRHGAIRQDEAVRFVLSANGGGQL